MRLTIRLSLFFIVLTLLFACTKKTGVNKDLAYSDKAFFDSCQISAQNYYLNNSTVIYPGNNGAHGTYKLRFNGIAYAALIESGKLPIANTMPEGSLIVKDVYSNGAIIQYAFMYKKSGAWLWAEYQANKSIIFSVNKSPDLCTNCHNQSGNRDLLLSFKYY